MVEYNKSLMQQGMNWPFKKGWSGAGLSGEGHPPRKSK